MRSEQTKSARCVFSPIGSLHMCIERVLGGNRDGKLIQKEAF